MVRQKNDAATVYTPGLFLTCPVCRGGFANAVQLHNHLVSELLGHELRPGIAGHVAAAAIAGLAADQVGALRELLAAPPIGGSGRCHESRGAAIVDPGATSRTDFVAVGVDVPVRAAKRPSRAASRKVVAAF